MVNHDLLLLFEKKKIRYATKSFSSGTAEVVNFNFQDRNAQASFTFNSGATGGTPTHWTIAMNGGSSISPGDGFSFGYDGFNSASYWFSVDGSGSGSGSEVAVLSSDSSTQVCDKLAAVAFTVGFFQSASDMMTYVSMNHESQSIPSSGSYGNVMTINSGSTDPGNYGSIIVQYVTGGTTANTEFSAAYANGSPSGTSVGTLSGNYTAAELATLFATGISGSIQSSYLSTSVLGNTLTITSNEGGQIASDSTAGGPISVVQNESGYGQVNWPSSPPPYIMITEVLSEQTYLVWLSLNSMGSAPGLSGNERMASATSGDSYSTIAQNIGSEFSAFGVGIGVASSDGLLTLTQGNLGNAVQPSATQPFTITVTTQGTLNLDLSTNAVTLASHGFITGVPVRLTTNGVLPAPLAINTTYYVMKVNANELKFASTLANAFAASEIDITDSGSGTHTIRQY